MGRPKGETAQERKHEKLGGKTVNQGPSAGLGRQSQCIFPAPHPPPSLSSMALATCSLGNLPASPLLCPQPSVPPLYTFYLNSLISPLYLLWFILTLIREA